MAVRRDTSINFSHTFDNYILRNQRHPPRIRWHTFALIGNWSALIELRSTWLPVDRLICVSFTIVYVHVVWCTGKCHGSTHQDATHILLGPNCIYHFDNCSMVVFMFYKIIIVPNPSLYHNCARPCMFSVRVCVSFAYRPMQPMNTCKLVPWLMTCATNRDNFNYIICLNQLCSLEFRTTKYTIHGRTETLAHSLWHRAEYLVWPLCAAHTAYALVHFHCSFYVNIVH